MALIQQMQEGTANITYKIGRPYHWSNLEEDWRNHNTSKGTTCQTITTGKERKEEEKKIIMLPNSV
jgi:hypothetical protein